jgi:hypothetical protein
MTPTPTGRWISRDDPMWERVWVAYQPPLINLLFECSRICRADVLLALDDAFLAWGDEDGV